ncbi:ABC transporter permease [bacterium]|nr:ABC transporter permease [bacterium]
MQINAEWSRFFRRFRHRHLAVIGLILVVMVLLFAILPPMVLPFDPNEMDIRNAMATPSGDHWLGTDQYGRDTLTRLAYGARISLKVGLMATGIALFIGVVVGSAAGYVGQKTDTVIMRFLDALMAFPGILLAIALVGVLGPGLLSLIVAIGIVSIPRFARLTRASVLQKKNLEYVLAARALGRPGWQILLSDVLPNCLSPLIVQITLTLPGAILGEAALSFLGLGTPPPAPSWGRMLNEARGFMEISPEQAVFPGLAIFIVVLGFNLLGDGLRDVLDPKLK